MPGVLSAAAGIGNPTKQQLQPFYISPLDENDEEILADIRKFQYFPESVQDTKAVNFQQKEIPGGSLPLYQWVSSGERILTFQATFTTDTDPEEVSAEQLKLAGVENMNVDVGAALTWLRSFMMPTYPRGGIVIPPQKLRLFMPGSGVDIIGGEMGGMDSILCQMTQCDITYEAFFPNGKIRIANVQLSFVQLAQKRGLVSFPDAQGMRDYYSQRYSLWVAKERSPG